MLYRTVFKIQRPKTQVAFVFFYHDDGWLIGVFKDNCFKVFNCLSSSTSMWHFPLYLSTISKTRISPAFFSLLYFITISVSSISIIVFPPPSLPALLSYLRIITYYIFLLNVNIVFLLITIRLKVVFLKQCY